MKKETRKKLCKKCLLLVRKEDTESKRAYRLKIKKGRIISGKVKLKHEKINPRTQQKGR